LRRSRAASLRCSSGRSGPATPRRAGFTLIELLLAMGLFTVLATGLVALLSRSSEFLATGASQTETMDSLQAFAEAFSADVSTLAGRYDSETGRPDVRLFCDYVPSDIDGDAKADLPIQRLFFVRVIPGEAVHPLTRAAGTKLGAKDYIDQLEDEDKAQAGTLKATGGLMEVFWTALPVPRRVEDTDYDPAVMQLWRGYRAPPGGPRSLLPVKWHRDPNATALERGPIDAKDIRAVATPVLSGVLHFGVEFWSRKTTTWDPQVRVREGGPLWTWDSTRGILPQGEGTDGFFFSKGKAGTDERSSLDDPTDDTFPRRIRVTCVVEELGAGARVGFLSEDLSQDAKAIELEDTRFFPASDTAQRYVKIGTEWIEVEGVRDGGLRVRRRGARGTLATAHRAGDKVHHGRTFIGEYDIAAFRDTYRDELPTITSRGGLGR
jgi:prepilin-type N-terminal cleavage/methylation domain-containing protein